jgi:hypothetical protein
MKSHNSCIFLVAWFLLLTGGRSQTPIPQADPLEIHLSDMPLDFEKVPLTKALSAVALSMDKEFVLFGTEIVTERGEGPLVSTHITGGSTLGEAIRQVLPTNPEYTFQVIGPHLVNVFPKNAPRDPNDILNLPIAALELANIVPSNFLLNPARYIPELKLALSKNVPRGCSIGPGLSGIGPEITVHIESSTVRKALNLVSEASIEAAQNSRGSASGWVYVHEKFPSEAFQEHKWDFGDVWRLRKAKN